MYILHNVLWTYPIVITSCLLIKSFFRWRSLPLYSWLKSIIFWWYCEERLDASHSVGSLRWEKLFSFRYRVPFKKMPWNVANRYHWATCCILRQNWKKKLIPWLVTSNFGRSLKHGVPRPSPLIPLHPNSGYTSMLTICLVVRMTSSSLWDKTWITNTPLSKDLNLQDTSTRYHLKRYKYIFCSHNHCDRSSFPHNYLHGSKREQRL